MPLQFLRIVQASVGELGHGASKVLALYNLQKWQYHGSVCWVTALSVVATPGDVMARKQR